MAQPTRGSKRPTTGEGRRAWARGSLEEREEQDRQVAEEEERMREEAKPNTLLPKLTPERRKLRSLIRSRSDCARKRAAREKIDEAYREKREVERQKGETYRMPWSSSLKEEHLVRPNLVGEQRPLQLRSLRARSTRTAKSQRTQSNLTDEPQSPQSTLTATSQSTQSNPTDEPQSPKAYPTNGEQKQAGVALAHKIFFQTAEDGEGSIFDKP